MPLTLLFSSTANTDIPYEFPPQITTERSLVVEIINVIGVRRRQAGWIYSSVDSGLSDTEIASSHTIMYGKNRCQFPVHPLPYRLKFFPVYGLTKYDLRVYSGTNLALPGTQLNATFVGRIDRGVRGGVIQYRSTIGATWLTVPGLAAIAQAYYRPGNNVLIVRTHQGEVFYCIVGTWTWIADTVANLRIVVAEPTTRALHQIETPQF
jgi:hypothetical protein